MCSDDVGRGVHLAHQWLCQCFTKFKKYLTNDPFKALVVHRPRLVLAFARGDHTWQPVEYDGVDADGLWRGLEDVSFYHVACYRERPLRPVFSRLDRQPLGDDRDARLIGLQAALPADGVRHARWLNLWELIDGVGGRRPI